MGNVKFISFDGKYPCLCYGTLVMEVNGKTYELKDVLCSGGGIFGCYTFQGEWSIDGALLPEELKPYINEIEEEVNCSVPWGCCGGCI